MRDLAEITACKQAEIDPVKMVDPINAQNVHVLIQSIIAGEDPTSGETPQDWRARVEQYAMELNRELYTASNPN